MLGTNMARLFKHSLKKILMGAMVLTAMYSLVMLNKLTFGKRSSQNPLKSVPKREKLEPQATRRDTATSQNYVQIGHNRRVDLRTWMDEQRIRKKHIQNTCSGLRQLSVDGLQYELTRKTLKTLNHLFVLDSHKLIYCFLPKVGCTSWKRIFLKLLGKFKNIKDISHMKAHYTPIPKLSQYSLEGAQQRLDNYTTFMFIRHPHQRIISCFRDKLEKDNADNRAVQRSFIGKLQRYADVAESNGTSDGRPHVTFPQFVRYVSDPTNVFHSYDATEHWNEMYKMCHPCLVRYDFVGEFDHLTRDANVILAVTGLRHLVFYPEPTNPTNSSGQDISKTYLSQLNHRELIALNRRYDIDAALFGYSLRSPDTTASVYL